MTINHPFLSPGPNARAYEAEADPPVHGIRELVTPHCVQLTTSVLREALLWGLKAVPETSSNSGLNSRNEGMSTLIAEPPTSKPHLSAGWP